MKGLEKEYIYFVGVGGIGMSALARYFNRTGKKVAGYDRSITDLTKRLQTEGISITYIDESDSVPFSYRDKEKTLIVYTPAIPRNSSILKYFREEGFECCKRAEILGLLSKQVKTIAVAGTHGKTTVSTMIAFILHSAGIKINAFLGGISRDFGTNLLLDQNAALMVTEADEYDRSFLQLSPTHLIVTSIDADHLDIYTNVDDLKETYAQLIAKVNSKGSLLTKPTIIEELSIPSKLKTRTYGLDKLAAIRAENIEVKDGSFLFDYHSTDVSIKGLRCGLPGIHNVENATAAITIALQLGVGEQMIRESVAAFRGVKRRFDIHLKTEEIVYIDDYAHHPEEIRLLLESVRELFPQKKVTAIFQPHLYSRTRDFGVEFAAALDKADDVILLELYPAREEPIEGIDSLWLSKKMEKKDVHVCAKHQLINVLKSKEVEVLLTVGAGDIDTMIDPIIQHYESIL